MKPTMRIRCGYAVIDGSDEIHEFKSGCIQVLADHGNTLWDLSLDEDGGLHISVGGCVKFNGVVLDDRPIIKPHAANCFTVVRPKYEP